MKTNLNGTQFRIVMAIWRSTYGYHKKEKEISYSTLAEYIEASRSQVAREIGALIDRKIILVLGKGKKGASVLKFNKNYEEWSQETSERRAGKLVEDKTTQKAKQPKKPTKKQQYSEENTYYKMASFFLGLVTDVAKDAGVEHLIRKANLQTWADDFRKLVEKDGVDKKKIHEVMLWVTQDSFWRTNILSASKFRKQFATLAIRMAEEKKGKQPKQQPQPKDTRDKDIEFQRFIAEGGNPDEFDWTG